MAGRGKTVTVRIDRDADEWARVASAFTGETKARLISRLLREHCPTIVAEGKAKLEEKLGGHGQRPPPPQQPPNKGGKRSR